MALRFPNARLHLINLLVGEKPDCVQAMISTIYYYQILPAGSLDGTEFPRASAECGSMFAARKILEGYFTRRPYHSQSSDAVWNELQWRIHNYKTRALLEHSRHPDVVPNPLECSPMAPVVLDYLLQLLRP